jgi:hypothetical protein
MKVLMLIIQKTLLVNGKIKIVFLLFYFDDYRFAWVNSLFAELILTHFDHLEEWLRDRRTI